MSNYLDSYGVVDARREKRNKRIVWTLLILAITGGTLWFLFKDYKQEAKIGEFLSLLEQKDYKSAYAMWGCTDAQPCRDYKFDRFLQDWGPNSDAGNVAAIKRQKVKSCSGGIIQLLQIKGQDVNLFVDRNSLVMGFAPWPVCKPRIQL